ncbi:hypothetical protein H5410_005075 [Solanum commersonii]|uniref:Uncharacterized protein n=1 Tax=Solanum commersonii TaxID=4109 RepID=A0A9J6A5N5_SOLCO|nr:hypothetical protein H5410_005075 [Solanum commersonii]
MSISVRADLVDEKENLTSPLMSKLSPQESKFVPTKNDMSDGEDKEDMLDIYFEKLAKEEDLSSRQQRSGSNKKKKKQRHGREHVEMVM